MNLWHYLWPWSKERKQRAKKAREVEARFMEQLKEAEARQDNLKEAVERLREERRKRSTGVHLPFPSHPVLS